MKIIDWKSLDYQQQQQLLSRPVKNNQAEIRQTTNDIIEQVRLNGDAKLFELAQQFDNASLSQLKVTDQEIQHAVEQLPSENHQAIQFAIKQIKSYHTAQIPRNLIVETCDGVVCERQARPIARVGLYVPGGSAPLISTVLMLAIPADLANCPLKIMCTPPNENGEIHPTLLAAAHLCGIETIYKVGGAQAIAAMAYGTESITKVDKIFGPGNAWVTEAKGLVSQTADGAACDLPAGPSEVFIIADEQANPEYVAADLLSQAEHGIDSQVICVTVSIRIAKQIKKALKKQLANLSRQAIAKQSLLHSRLIVVEDIQQAIQLSNQYAPEHLILQVFNPEQYIHDITAAGAVFLGQWTPETVGDYVTGSNHVLPTYGYANKYSGLSVTDFMTYISFQKVTDIGLLTIANSAVNLAETEGLDGHANAVKIRINDLKANYAIN